MDILRWFLTVKHRAIEKKYYSIEPATTSSPEVLYEMARYLLPWNRKRRSAGELLQDETYLRKLRKSPVCQSRSWEYDPEITLEVLIKLKEYNTLVSQVKDMDFAPAESYEGQKEPENGFRHATDEKKAKRLLAIQDEKALFSLVVQTSSQALRLYLLKMLKRCPFCNERLTEASLSSTREVGAPADSFYRETVTYTSETNDYHLWCRTCELDFARNYHPALVPYADKILKGPLRIKQDSKLKNEKKAESIAASESASEAKGVDAAPIFAACAEGKLNEVKAFFSANLNLNPELLNTVNERGQSFLHVAVKSGRLDVVEYLLTLSPNVNIMDKERKYIPLHYAVEHLRKSPDQKAIISLLVKHGSELEVKRTDASFTPLGLARTCGYGDLCELLIPPSEQKERATEQAGKDQLKAAQHEQVIAEIKSVVSVDEQTPAAALKTLKKIARNLSRIKKLDDGYGLTSVSVIDEEQWDQVLRGLGFKPDAGSWHSTKYELEYAFYPGYFKYHIAEIRLKRKSESEWKKVF